MTKWIRMTCFHTKTETRWAEKNLKKAGWGVQVKKHKTKIVNRIPCNYTVYRTEQKVRG